MADVYEIMKSKNGNLGPKELVNEKITDIVSELYVYMLMLPPERKNEIELIANFRTDIVRLRWYIDESLIEKPKEL